MEISTLTTQERVELRDKLNKSLPGLEAVSLQHELSDLFSDAKDALQDAMADPGINTAPVINAVTALIKQMTVFQETLYSTERQKSFEEAIITTLKDFSPDLAEIVLDKFEENLQ